VRFLLKLFGHCWHDASAMEFCEVIKTYKYRLNGRFCRRFHEGEHRIPGYKVTHECCRCGDKRTVVVSRHDSRQVLKGEVAS
jgi:hypothetical protein